MTAVPTGSRYIGWLTVTIFALLISLPSLYSLWEPDREISRKEKRKLAKLPDTELLFTDQETLREKINAYVNDHIGFRDDVIAAHSAIKVKLFGVSPSPHALLGRDRWIYHSGSNSLNQSTVSDYRGRYRLTTENLDRWYQNHLALVNHLDSKGIEYVAVIAPNKQSVHPEYLPDRIQSSAGSTILDQFTDYLSDKPVEGLLNLKPGLKKLGQTGPVYRRADTHWNQKGYLFGYQQIIHSLHPKITGLGNPFNREQMLEKEKTKIGDLSLLVGLPDYFSEKMTDYEPLEPCAKLDRGESLVDIGYQANQYAKVYSCENRTGSLMFIHDSFGAPLLPLLAEHFGETFASRFGNVTDLERHIDRFRPDAIIHLRVERELQSLFPADEKILNQYYIDAFENRSNEVESVNLSHAHLQASGGSSRIDGNDLVIESTSNDPNFIIPFEHMSNPASALTLRVSISSPARDRIAVYYTTEDNPEFSEDKKTTRKIKSGENNLFLRVTAGSNITGMRLDPGRQPGVFSIQFLDVLYDQPRGM